MDFTAALPDFDALPLPRIKVDKTLGAAFIGNVLAAILYGLTCLQTYSVYQQKKDRTWMKVLLLVLLTLDTLHFIAVSNVLYYYLISNYSNPAAMATQDLWAATTYYIVTGIMEFIIRGVFTFRVWRLSDKNWILTFSIVVTSLIDLAGNLAFAFKNLQVTTFPDISSISWIFYMAFGGSITADIITAVALCFLLKKRSTGFKRTDSFINMMMLYSVNTGALSTLCSLMVMIMYIRSHQDFLYVPFYFILPGVMLNSLLATLYASQRMWERGYASESGHLVTVPVSTAQFAQLAPGSYSSRGESKDENRNNAMHLGVSLHDIEMEEKVITISGNCATELVVEDKCSETKI
ncbi:hypothetical protein BDY19DRAFT_1057980 [Irpex rosettiformis]|uniref:Uncharacterized protein n=1 Tax=Irpex rosettiformis TaxID=378272 RepID=A0ACB8TZG1_9APHY|nr:hypothetical protein BDY19DRAFT_1057980 [Irpex rosettiformis]